LKAHDSAAPVVVGASRVAFGAGAPGARRRDRPRRGSYIVREFLEQGVEAAPHHRLDEFVDPDGTVSILSGDLVFQEAPSLLRRPDGTDTGW
jgi:hypothetical protein